MLRQIKLVVFDLDYLVFDCRPVKAQALRQSLIALADVIPHHVRLPDAADIETAFLEHGCGWLKSIGAELDEKHLPDFERVYQIHEQRLIESGAGKTYAGIEALLDFCRREGVSAALGAEATRDYLMTVCDRQEFDRIFETILCTEEFGSGGAGEMLADILARQEVNPSEAVVLGTRPAFFDACHSLDLMTIGCAWGIQEQSILDASDFPAQAVEHVVTVLHRIDEIAAQHAG